MARRGRQPQHTSRSRRRLGTTRLAAAGQPELAVGGRRARKGFGKLGRRVLTLIVVVALAWIGWEVFRSSLFRIARFQVAGAETVGQSEIVQAAALWDQSIFLADFAAAAVRVRTLPGIQDARVRGEFPDCCIIEVAEREPQVVWQVGDQRYWVDEEGFVVPPGESLPRSVVIVDQGKKPVAPGDQVDADAVRTAQQLDHLLPTDLRPAQYEYARESGVTVPSTAGWQACFGTSERLDAKVRVLQAILDDVRARKAAVSYIDLRPQNRPYTR